MRKTKVLSLCLPRFLLFLWFTSSHLFVSDSLSVFVLYEQPLLSPVSLSVSPSAFQFTSSCSLSSTWQPCCKSRFMTWEMRQDWAHARPTLPPLPLNSPPLQPLQLHSPPILSPSLRAQVANNSSHSSNHNQCKATLKVFSVVNVVKALMGGLKSGGQIKYQLRISLKAYMKWWSDDLIVIEMLFSLLAHDKNGHSQNKLLAKYLCLLVESDILWILGWIPLWGMSAILC